MILSGNGRFMNKCGKNLPTLPMRRARPRTAMPIFFMMAMTMIEVVKTKSNTTLLPKK